MTRTIAFGHARPDRLARLLMMILVLAAFGRLVWRLDAKSLWWDESLSLQRAESPWPTLLAGRLDLEDGHNRIATTDQHPFAFFALLGALTRLAGQSEFVLRFPAVVAATLLVPMSWAFARLAVRMHLLPPATPLWAAFFAAINPFFLWYGREARMYTGVAFLALLSTYLLMRWSAVYPAPPARAFLVAFLLAATLLLCTHYFGILLLPIYAGLLFTRLSSYSRRRAFLVSGGLLAVGLVLGVMVAAALLRSSGSGSNFSPVSLRILAADLLNAFSLGLSVDIARVRWLDYIFGMIALIGALWCWRPGATRPRDAWLLPAFLLLPILSLVLIQILQPAYMNARHMSLVSGAFVLLVGGGVAAVWTWRVWAGGLVAALLLAGTLYSSVNYFVSPLYARDDFTEVGADLLREIQPGDAVILMPPEMSRLYRYYLPVDLIEQSGRQTEWLGAPLLGAPLRATEESLQGLLNQHRRTWLVVSGMVPFNPWQDSVKDWLLSHAWLAREIGYQSNTVLQLKLFLPRAPVLDTLPKTVQHSADAVFDDRVRLSGYDIEPPLAPENSIPVTLYWQADRPMNRNYKYILRLLADDGVGGFETLAITERQPYDGSLPTTYWQPGQTIMEYVGLSPVSFEALAGKRIRLALQIYDAESLAKLPITHAEAGVISADGETLLLPYEP